MTRVIVGKWGKNLAIRVPHNVARRSGLVDGDPVEIEAVDGDLVIRRTGPGAHTRRDAEAAADEITRNAVGYTLGHLAIRALRDEGLRE